MKTSNKLLIGLFVLILLFFAIITSLINCELREAKMATQLNHNSNNTLEADKISPDSLSINIELK